MNQWIRLEEFVLFVLAYIMTMVSGFAWWVFWVLLLLPDLSMLGYLAGTKTGALVYNVVHHRGLAIIIGLAGYFLQIPWLMLLGIILFGHSTMDRVFGYGLKYSDDFKHTHMGWLSKRRGD